MKNNLFYYYHLYPESIIKKAKEYHFEINNILYKLLPITRTGEEIGEIVELNLLLPSDIFPKIIKNRVGQYVTFINNHNYILIRSNNKNKKINWHDFIKNNFYYINLNQFPHLNHSNWIELWIKKIDYFEYQKNYIKNKYPLLYNSLDYYVGLAENAISYRKEVERQNYRQETERVGIAHRRVNSEMNQEELNSPFNIILDYQERDQSEYLKSLFLKDKLDEKEIDKMMEETNNSEFGYSILMARLLFPSFYFDQYEKIINDKEKEESILCIINKADDYEYFLSYIWNQIVKKRRIPAIDWLKIK